MKLLVYIPLMLLSLILHAQEVKEIETNTEWTGRHCRGTVGMCNSSPKNGGNTVLSLSGEELIFKVYRNRITLEEETTILGKQLKSEGNDIYTMDEPFELSEDLVVALGIQKKARIPIGDYPVLITKAFVEIAFRIEMN